MVNHPNRSKKLSATMAAAVVEIIDHGGKIEAWRGGWWTYPGCPVERTTYDGYRVPTWSIGTTTVRALVSRNMLTITKYAEPSHFPIGAEINPRTTS
jgi:hypothetical protein